MSSESTVRVLPHPHCSVYNCFSIFVQFFPDVAPHFLSAHDPPSNLAEPLYPLGGCQAGGVGSFPRTKWVVCGGTKIHLLEFGVKYLNFGATYLSFGAMYLNFGATYLNFGAVYLNFGDENIGIESVRRMGGGWVGPPGPPGGFVEKVFRPPLGVFPQISERRLASNYESRDWLARGYIPAHQHCELFYSLAGDPQGRPKV